MRKKILGTDSAKMRHYGEATKTRRAWKSEKFGNQGKKSDTSIELWAEAFLKEEGFNYVKQKAVRYLNYDFYLPDQNILIEIQGDYHHINPRVYPNGPKNDLQKENLVKNQNKKDIAESCNIPLLAVWQLDIEKGPDQTKKQILKFIQKWANYNQYVYEETDYER